MKRLSIALCVLTLLMQFSCAGEGAPDEAERASASAPTTTAAGPTPGDHAESSAKDADAPAVGMTPPPVAAAGGSAAAPPRMAPAAPSTATTPAASSAGGVPGIAPTLPAAPMTPAGSASSAAPTTPASSPTTGLGNSNVQAGTLTAGVWDDNMNFERFKKYRSDLQKQQLPGILPSSDDEHNQAHEAFQQRGALETLDISLVIDTTGSMGDEIRYLQAEFTALSNSIESKYPNAKQRWSLVVYRDKGDEYLTRTFDFSEDAEDFRSKLSMQVAAGGGDFPESPDAALAAMAQLGWRDDDKTAKLVFWVADAPHHNDKASAMLDAIHNAKNLGVHIYPVASSGVDELTELTMRTSAQLTGGRYLFLTDDSGVGGAHKEPSIPCYFVTRLDQAILRMVDVELTGKYEEPSMDSIIRTSGQPENGMCALESGESVAIF